MQDKRDLARIESDLTKAENAFIDADTRLKAAERERTAALHEIDKHQAEMDVAIIELRKRSSPGSRWRIELETGSKAPASSWKASQDDDGSTLVLRSEDIDKDEQDPVLRIAPGAGTSHSFDRLKMVPRAADGSKS